MPQLSPILPLLQSWLRLWLGVSKADFDRRRRKDRPKNDCVRTYAHAGGASVRPDSKPASRLPETPLVGSDDRVTVLEFDLVDVPCTAGSAAAQRVNLKRQLVTGL